MFNKEKYHWLLVYLSPYILIGVLTYGAGFVMVPLGGVIGVFVGLASTAPFYTLGVKLSIAAACFVSVVIFRIGYKMREKLWGKAINAMGAYLWCFTGIYGFGPQ